MSHFSPHIWPYSSSVPLCICVDENRIVILGWTRCKRCTADWDSPEPSWGTSWKTVVPVRSPARGRTRPLVENPQLSAEQHELMNTAEQRGENLAGGSLRSPAGRPRLSSLLGSVRMTSADSTPVTSRPQPAAATAPSSPTPSWGKQRFSAASSPGVSVWPLSPSYKPLSRPPRGSQSGIKHRSADTPRGPFKRVHVLRKYFLTRRTDSRHLKGSPRGPASSGAHEWEVWKCRSGGGARCLVMSTSSTRQTPTVKNDKN